MNDYDDSSTEPVYLDWQAAGCLPDTSDYFPEGEGINAARLALVDAFEDRAEEAGWDAERVEEVVTAILTEMDGGDALADPVEGSTYKWTLEYECDRA